MMKQTRGIFRRVSLTTKIVLLTAVVGLVLWALTDWYQARTLGDIYRAQLYEHLEEHGAEKRNLLDKYFKAYFKLGTMVVSGKRFHDYLDYIEDDWHEGEAGQIKYHKRQPTWFPDPSLLRPFAQARYVLLLDPQWAVREAYIRKEAALPEFLLDPHKNLPQLEWGNSFLTSVDGAPYAITSEPVMDSSGKPRAILLLATPMDDEFLNLAQVPYLHGGNPVALVGGIEPSIIASSDPELLPPGAMLDDLEDKYLVIGQAFFDYGNSDLLIRHAIFAPKEKIRTMTEAFISKERYKRTATTLAIIATFSIIMLQISRRIKGVTQRIEDFSEKALGGGPRDTVKGDQLAGLEDRFHQLAEEVVGRTTQLEAANAQLQTLVHAIPGAVFFKDAQGRHLVVNKACADLIGSNEEEILGKTVDEIMPPDMAEECRRSDEEVIRARRSVRTEESNGGTVLEAIKSPLFDDSGDYQGMVGLVFDVTERKRAGEALRESEERFRSIFENAAMGMALTGADSTFLQVNDSMCRIVGFSKEELLGMSFQDITHPEDMKLSLAALQNLLLGKMDTCSFEKRYICKSGEIIWALLNVTAIRDPDGEFLYFMTEVNDITLRKWLEEALMESEEKYHVLIESASDAIMVADVETGIILEANRKAGELLEMPSEKIIGMHHSELYPEDERDYCMEEFREAVKRGEFVSSDTERDVHVLTKGGRKIPVEISSNIIKLDNRDVSLAILRDITQRKETEKALKEGKQFLSNVLNCIQDGISIISKDFTVLMVNPATEKWYPHRMPLVGKKCYEAFRYRTEPCDPCPAVKAIESGQSVYEVVPFFRPGGGVGSGELHTFPLTDPETGKITGVIEYFRDITEKATLQEEAVRAAQLASVGELAAGVAHEINNPINGIINYAQILVNRLGHDDMEGELAQRIIKEGDRISDIVRALLSFTRADQAINNSLHVNVLMSEVFLLTTSQLAKDGINIKATVPSELPTLKGNQRQIEQVFLNIINNARHALNEKYTGAHENKTLEISGEKVVVDEAPYVRMTFHDRGTGIPADIIDKVTDPFFTTKPKGVGTGLGLSISQGIINSHGGRLFIESIEGEFTKVVIDLPEGEER